VVCRQLGFESALTALCCDLFGEGSGRVWLSDVSCSGKEASLKMCSNKGWDNNKCKHTQDAAVVCKTAKSSEKGKSLRQRRNQITHHSIQLLLMCKV
jgi:hypothetical protein